MRWAFSQSCFAVRYKAVNVAIRFELVQVGRSNRGEEGDEGRRDQERPRLQLDHVEERGPRVPGQGHDARAEHGDPSHAGEATYRDGGGRIQTRHWLRALRSRRGGEGDRGDPTQREARARIRAPVHPSRDTYQDHEEPSRLWGLPSRI